MNKCHLKTRALHYENANLAAAILSEFNYPTTEVICDGQLHRFGKKQVCWYICFDNWLIAGDWSGNSKSINQPLNETEYKFLSDFERQEMHDNIMQLKLAAEREKEKLYQEIAVNAQNLWLEYSYAGRSKYLENKGLKPIDGIKFGADKQGNFIATALIDSDGKIWSLQKIYDNPLPDGRNKSFLKGGKIKGLYSLFGNLQSATIYICEGVATALSILLALPNVLMVVAYSCHNFKAVAKNIKQKYRNKKIIIVADNDTKTGGFYE